MTRDIYLEEIYENYTHYFETRATISSKNDEQTRDKGKTSLGIGFRESLSMITVNKENFVASKKIDSNSKNFNT